MLLFHKLSGLFSSDSLACLWETTFSLILGQCDYKPQKIPLSLFLGAGEGSVTDRGWKGRVSSGIKFIKDWRVPSSLWPREGFHRVKDGVRAQAKCSPSSVPFSPFPVPSNLTHNGSEASGEGGVLSSLKGLWGHLMPFTLDTTYSTLPIQSGCFAISFTISVPSDVCRSLFQEALSYM